MAYNPQGPLFQFDEFGNPVIPEFAKYDSRTYGKPGYETGIYDPDAPGARPVVVDEDGNVIQYDPELENYDELNSVKVETVTQDIGNPARFPLLRLDPSRYRTVEDRLRFFAANNRFFTNNDITESRDHAVDSNEIIYPVYRINNEFGTFNVGRLVYETVYNVRYDAYFPLNKYKKRLAARINREFYLDADRRELPDAWYDYAWYFEANSEPLTGILMLPLEGCTEEEFEQGNVFWDWKLTLFLAVVAAVFVFGLTAFLSESPKLSLILGVCTFFGIEFSITAYTFASKLEAKLKKL